MNSYAVGHGLQLTALRDSFELKALGTLKVTDPPRRIRFDPILVHRKRTHRGDPFKHTVRLDRYRPCLLLHELPTPRDGSCSTLSLPYLVKLCLNGHEWVKQQFRRPPTFRRSSIACVPR